MPQSPTRVSLPAAMKNENQMLIAIASQPELFDSLDAVFGAGRRKQKCLDDLVSELNCSAEVLKKVWQAAGRNEKEKKALAKEAPAETRPRSTRSSSTEPRETRRSTRSQSIDKTISIAATSVESTDNSCASSMCGSPRSEDGRQQQQQQQRKRKSSRRNLYSINEGDINLDSEVQVGSVTTTSSAGAELTQQPSLKSGQKQRRAAETAEESGKPQRKQQQKEEEEEQDEKQQAEVVKAEDNVSDSGSADHRQPAEPTVTTLDEAAQTTRRPAKRTPRSHKKYVESKCAIRFSEPGLSTSRNGSGNQRQLSIRQGGIAAGKLSSNPEESTRLFFESIGLTVMNFPQHLQATIKAQVSEMVHEIEFQLSTPDDHELNDKSISVAS